MIRRGMEGEMSLLRGPEDFPGSRAMQPEKGVGCDGVDFRARRAPVAP